MQDTPMVVVASNYGSQIHRTQPEHPVTFCGLPPAKTYPAGIRWQDVEEHLRCVRCAAMDPKLLSLYRILPNSGLPVRATAAEIGMRARSVRAARKKAREVPRRPTW